MTSPNLFMWIITALFAASFVRHAFDLNWPQMAYALGAVILNLSVIAMSAK